MPGEHIRALRCLASTFRAKSIPCKRTIWDNTGEEIPLKQRVSEEQAADHVHMLCHAVSFLPTLQEFSVNSMSLEDCVSKDEQ